MIYQITNTITSFGYKQSDVAHTLFFKHQDAKTMLRIKKSLILEFEIKDLCKLGYFLDIENLLDQKKKSSSSNANTFWISSKR